MNIKSKGFTIVELAIVLVVIGLIMGMAVKGKALVEAARYRMEVTKIRNMEVYLYAYHAATDGDIKIIETSDPCTKFIDLRPMLDGGILTYQDLDSYFIGWKEGDMSETGQLRYSYRVFEQGGDGIGPLTCYYDENDFRYAWIAPTYKLDLAATELVRTQVDWKYACKLENLIDEGNIYEDRDGHQGTPGNTGIVRVLANSSDLTSSFSYEDFEDCDTLPATAPASGKVFMPFIYMGETIF
jgi:prepilin-type N-terminal cleavage/methylation domain-containing protein